jgi:nicotinamide-nucleotide amidase
VFAVAERGADPERIVADARDFDDSGRGGVRLQAALCALELLMPPSPPEPPAEPPADAP